MNQVIQAEAKFFFIGDETDAINAFSGSPVGVSFFRWCLSNLERHTPLGEIDKVLSFEYLESIGFIQVKDDGQYGVYHNKAGVVSRHYGPMGEGKRIITFNRDGNWVGIKEDAGTRTVFNGVINSRDEFEIILNAVH